MTAIFFGTGTGLERNNAWYLGARAQMGDPAQGRAADQVRVNASNGNLVIQNTDEVLIGRGPDAAIGRTYNSQGTYGFNGTADADNWWGNTQRKIDVTQKAAAEPGGKLNLTDWDGTVVEFSFVNGQSRYQANGLHPYSDDYITFAGNIFTWTDGKTGAVQRFQYFLPQKTARLISVADTETGAAADRNVVTYNYDSTAVTGRLTEIVTQNHTTGQSNKVALTYVGATRNVATMVASYSDLSGATPVNKTLTRTRYAYESTAPTARLTGVTVDLSPEDNSVADGKSYTTTYSYIGTSKRIGTITQQDGSSLSILYDANGRVTQLNQIADTGIIRTTVFAYNAAGQMVSYTDALGNQTTMEYDALNRVRRLVEPAAVVDGLQRITTIAYDTLNAAATGTLAAVTNTSDIRVYDGAANEAAGIYLTREYRRLDANANLVEQGSIVAGNAAGGEQATIVRRTFNANNDVIRETAYTGVDGDGPGLTAPTGALTSRYVYDAERHLRYVISAAGRVTEYVYNTPGQLASTIDYTDTLYAVAGLAENTVLTEAQLNTWRTAIADKSSVERSDTVYDFRGNIASVTSYSKALTTGLGDTAAPLSRTHFIYDQYGKLLKRLVEGASQSELFVYDGLGRVISSTDLNGSVTTITINDGTRLTTISTPTAATQETRYTEAGELAETTVSGADVGSATSNYRYDRLGRLRVITDATGVKSYMLYDRENRKVADVDQDGSVVEYRYDAANRLIATIAHAATLTSAQLDVLNDTTVDFQFATLGLDSVAAANRRSWNIYDRSGRLVQSIDATGAVVGFEYDGASRLVRRTIYATRISVSGFAASLPSTVQAVPADAANDRVERNFYDLDGLLVATLDAEGALTDITYDAAGRKTRTLTYATPVPGPQRSAADLAGVKLGLGTTADDIASHFYYDGRGLLIATADGEGQVARFSYTARGDLASEQRGEKVAGGATRPNLATATGPQILLTTYTRRATGQVSSSTSFANGVQTAITNYAYDSLGRLIGETTTDTLRSEARSTTNRYDSRGRLIATVGGRGSDLIAANPGNEAAIIEAYGTRFVYDIADRLIARIDPAANKTVFYYDTDGNLRFEINAKGEVVEHRHTVFDQEASTIIFGGRLTPAELAPLSGGLQTNDVIATVAALEARTSGLNSVSSMVYNIRGELVQATDAGGFVSTFDYTTFGQLLSETRPSDATAGTNDIATYSYDRRGLKIGQIRLLNGTTTGQHVSAYGYDAFGRLVSMATAADGRAFAYKYDRNSRMVQSTDRMGASESFTYDALGNQFSHTDRTGRTTQFTYNFANRTVTTTTGENIQTVVTKNAWGQSITIRDGENRTTTYEYDKSGNLTRVADAAGQTLTGYDSANRVLDVTDGRGVRTHYEYDVLGRVMTRTENADAILEAPAVTTSFEYDAKGQQVRIVDGLNVVTLCEYDLRGHKVRLVQDLGGLNIETRYLIGPGGKAKAQIDAYGTADQRRTGFEYDSMGRLVRTIEDEGRLNIVTNFTFDEHDNLIATSDNLGRVTRFVYDRENRQRFVINAEGEVTETGYDAEGRVIWSHGYVTRTAVPTLESPATTISDTGFAATLITSADDRISKSAYDGDGRLVYAVDAEGFVTRNTYDNANNVKTTTRYAGAISVAKGANAGTIAGLLGGAVLGDAVVTSYTYDGANRLTDITDPVGAVTHFDMDALGQIVATKVASGTGDEAVTTRVFDALGRVVHETRASGVVDVAATMHYAYDKLGRVTSMTDALNTTTVRSYDAVGRMLTETVPLNDTQSATTTYQYDTRGNRVKMTDPRGNIGYFYYDGTDRLELQIDPEGFATKTSYSIGDAVSSVTRYFTALAAGSYTETARPDLTTTTSPRDATTQFVRDRLDRVIQTIDAENKSEFYTLNAFGDRIAFTNKLTGVTRYSYDHRGLVTEERLDAFENSAGYVKNSYAYDSRGNLLTMTEAPGLAEARTTTYTYDKLDRLKSKTGAVIQNAGIPTESYEYDLRGNLIKSSDSTGATVYAYFDDHNRKIAEISPVGTLTTMEYDLNGNLQVQRVFEAKWPGTPVLGGTAPVGTGAHRETQFDYDKNNRLTHSRVMNVTVGRMEGGVYVNDRNVAIQTVNTYDAGGNLILETDANGGQIFHYYDKLGREIAKVDQQLYLTTWIRDSEGNVEEEIRYAKPLDDVPTTGAVPSGEIHLDNRKTTFSYDKMGRRTLLTRWNLRDVMDAATGTLTEVTNSEISYKYNALGEVERKIEANKDDLRSLPGDTTDYVYDEFGRLLRQLDQGFEDFAGNAIRKVTEYRYDALNNVTRTEERANGTAELSGRVTTYSYHNGRLSSVTDAENFVRNFSYDLAGRLTREDWQRKDSSGTLLSPEGSVTVYDHAGRVISQYKARNTGSWAQASVATELEYNAYGEVTARKMRGEMEATGHTQELFEYDNGGRLVRTTSGDGVWKVLVYDRNGNATLTITSNGRDLSNVSSETLLNELGSIVAMPATTTDIVVTISVYDARNMAIASIEPNRTVASAANSAVTEQRNLTRSQRYNAFGEAASEVDARGNITSYFYNTMGRMVRKVSPQVQVTDEHGAKSNIKPVEFYYYDAAGRMVGSRDANGNLNRRELLAGTGHEGEEAIVLREYRADGSVWNNGYDVYRDMRFAIDGLATGGGVVRKTVYTYDKLGRLTQLIRPSGTLTEGFTYDGLGQRVGRWNSVQATPIYDYANPYISGYDGEGFPTYDYPIIGYDPIFERTNYDIEGRVSSVLSIAGDLTTTSYAWEAGIANTGLGLSGGWNKTITYIGGLTSIEKTDAFGHMVARKDQGNHYYSMTYNRAGQLAQQNGTTTGSQVSYTYDNSGRLSRIEQLVRSDVSYETDPETGQTYSASRADLTEVGLYTYDADGNRLSERYESRTAHYEGFVDPTTFGVTWTFSGNGTPEIRQDARAEFDALNRMTLFTDSGASGNGAVTVINQYDANGNVRRTKSTYKTFDSAGNLTANDATQDYWYRYDALNRFVTVKGVLIGQEGSATAFITRGFGEGRDIEYDYAGQRTASISESVTYPFGFPGPDQIQLREGQGGFIGATFTAYAEQVNQQSAPSYLGSAYDTGATIFVGSNFLIEFESNTIGGFEVGSTAGVYFPEFNAYRYTAANGAFYYVFSAYADETSDFNGLTIPPGVNTTTPVEDPAQGGIWLREIFDFSDGVHILTFFTPTGTAGFTPYADGAGRGYWYQASDGATQYLYRGDTSAIAGHGGMALPLGYPSNVAGVGQWQQVTDAGASTPHIEFVPGTSPGVYVEDWNLTSFSSSDPALSFWVVGNHSPSGSDTDYTGKIIPTTRGVYDPISDGVWTDFPIDIGEPVGTIYLPVYAPGNPGTGGGFTPYADTQGRGYWYQAADGATQYLYRNDTAVVTAHNGLALPASYPSTIAGVGQWRQSVDAISGALFIEFVPGAGTSSGVFVEGWDLTYFYAADGTSTYWVPGNHSPTGSNTEYAGKTIPTARGVYDPVADGVWTEQLISLGTFGSFTAIIFTPGPGGGTGFTPYADTQGRGYWYQAADGATQYLYRNDTAVVAAHNGLALPGSYPSAVAGVGEWKQSTDPISGALFIEFVPEQGGSGTNSSGVFINLWGYTRFLGSDGATEYYVLGNHSPGGTNIEYGGKAYPGALGYDSASLGTWSIDTVFLAPGEPENILVFTPGGAPPTYPQLNPGLGGTFYQNSASTIYFVKGDLSGGTPAYTNLTPPTALPALFAGVGTWYASSAGVSVPTLVLGDMSGGTTPSSGYYYPVWNLTSFLSGDGVTSFWVLGDHSATGSNTEYGGKFIPATRGVYDVPSGGVWTDYPLDLGEFGIITVPLFTPGTPPSYPYLDTPLGGTYYQNGAGAVYFVKGDLTGGTAAYTNLTPPAVLPQLVADVGTWYATIAGVTVPTLVLGDLSGGFTPYADFAGRGYWYRAAGSFTDYLWLGDTAANLAHNGKTLPTSFPARDEALAGTWEQVTEYSGTYGEIITTYVQFRPDPSYPYYDTAANGTRYRDAQGNTWLVVGDTSGSAGAYAGYPPPATIPSFQGTIGTWLTDPTLGTKLVLGQRSYLDAGAGGTRYRTAGGLDYLVVGDLSGGNAAYTNLTPPESFPGWDTSNPYGLGLGTWYSDAPLGLRLVLGDTYAQPVYLTRSIERYTYNLDGYLTDVHKLTQSAQRQFGVETGFGPLSTPQLISTSSYDALGRVTGTVEYDANGGFVYERYGIVYDLRSLVLAEKTKLRQFVDNAYAFTYTHSVNSYTARGDGDGPIAGEPLSSAAVGVSTGSVLRYSYTKQWYDRNNDFFPGVRDDRDFDLADTYTTYAYDHWDSAQQKEISLSNRDGTSISTYSYDKLGHVSSVAVGGPRAHNVNYTTDAAGQVISRFVTGGPSGQNPKQFYSYFNGIQIGSNGNNGNDNPDLAAAIAEKAAAGPTTPGIFRNGATSGSQYANFDRSYDPVTSGNPGGSGSVYTVQGGETLQSIATAIWGDASMWYMIAQANGLNAGSQLSAGQALVIPNKVANARNAADTFRPYDATRALGDTQPQVPKPVANKNKNCGFIGVILRAIVKAIIKAAVVIIAQAVPVIGTILALPIIGPAISASVISAASQGINTALGLQDRVEWKGVATAGISAGVSDGLSRIGGPVGKFLNSSGLPNIIIKAAIKNVITQGISTVTGLQKKFSWTNVAVAGVTAGAEKIISDELGAPDTDIEEFGKKIIVGAAGLIAGEAARSLIKGTDFGDYVLAALPDLIEDSLADSLAPFASQAFEWLGRAIDRIGGPVAVPVAGQIGSENASQNFVVKVRTFAAETSDDAVSASVGATSAAITRNSSNVEDWAPAGEHYPSLQSSAALAAASVAAFSPGDTSDLPFKPRAGNWVDLPDATGKVTRVYIRNSQDSADRQTDNIINAWSYAWYWRREETTAADALRYRQQQRLQAMQGAINDGDAYTYRNLRDLDIRNPRYSNGNLSGAALGSATPRRTPQPTRVAPQPARPRAAARSTPARRSAPAPVVPQQDIVVNAGRVTRPQLAEVPLSITEAELPPIAASIDLTSLALPLPQIDAPQSRRDFNPVFSTTFTPSTITTRNTPTSVGPTRPSVGLQATSLAVDFIPFVGAGKSIIATITGRDPITGEAVNRWEEGAGILLGLIPGGKLLIRGRKIAGLGEEVLRHGDDLADAASRADELADAARRTGGNRVYRGGSHRDMSAPKNDGLDSHHTPDRNADPNVSAADGPAIQMDPWDHHRTSSNGRNGRAGARYRAETAEMIDRGDYRGAMAREIRDARRAAGQGSGNSTKYNRAIQEMLDYAKRSGQLPANPRRLR